MPGVRWVLSLLIAYHLLALGSAAIPSPDALTPVSEIRRPTDDPIAAIMTPGFDRAAIALSKLEPALFSLVAPVRDLTRPYISAGLGGQQWNMFSSPYTEDKYVRLDYYVANDRDPSDLRLLRELVLPADHEEGIRLYHQFRDKAILNTLETYMVGVATDQSAPSAWASSGLDSHDREAQRRRVFEPITKYFASRLARTLRPDERLVRTELWYGVAPIPGRSLRVDRETMQARLQLLAPFHEGPAAGTGRVLGGYQQSGSVQREADVEWTLTFIQGPTFSEPTPTGP